MPQPAANDVAARQLIAVYEDSYKALLDEYARALDQPSTARRAARLRELLRTHETTMATLRETTVAWMNTTVPALHAAGATATADALGSSFRWSMPHRSAVEDFATRTWDDVGKHLRDISSTTRDAIRREVRAATRTALTEGRTATQAGRTLAREAARNGLWSVEYSNGAIHTMRDYADMAIRTTTAESYNRGSATQCAVDGIEYVEYADGAGCGVYAHNDGDEANGQIVKLVDVVYLSHPNCRRAILPAPFAKPLDDADRSLGGDDRGEEPPVIPAREPREPREPRTPRG